MPSLRAQVFTQHPQHRTVVLDELLNTLLKLPTSGRKLRTFELAEEDNMHIQMITAVLLQCIQGCVSLPEELEVSACIPQLPYPRVKGVITQI
eukprot:1196144-Prorocentrum_minimum.AAC.4